MHLSHPCPASVVDCGPFEFEEVVNGHVIGEESHYGSTVIIQCKDGLRMLDGSQSKSITCTSLGVWTDVPSTCKGEYNNALSCDFIIYLYKY